MLRSLAVSMLFMVRAIAAAEPAPKATELIMGLAGEWTGALDYKDYQSGELLELPVKTSIRNVPDGVTQLRQSEFDEGAKKAPVWITTASIIEKDGAQLTYAGFRNGRETELRQQQLSVQHYENPTKWTLVYSEQGLDGDSKSDIRITETRDGDSLKEVKEVRPLNDAKAAWTFRNQTVLKRVGDPK